MTRKIKLLSILFLGISFLFFECNQPKQIKNNGLKTESKLKIDSLLPKKNILKNTNNENAPIKIIKATLLNNDYSQHKDIQIVYQNSGKKAIKAIKYELSCINAFEEPASGYYFYNEGNFKRKITCLIKAGQIKTEIWEDFSTDADKIIQIRAYYIVFTDGTKWQLQKEENPID